MSPEQTEDSAGVDVRSDVYALGVLLYELLTQELPIDGRTIGSEDEDKIKRAIRERTPERPSKRTHSRTTTSGKPAAALAFARPLPISPDLDWIALRALEKEPARRYQTAAELAEDVRRHIEHEAVLARPPGFAYATGRWARRRKRVLLASALGVVATSVLIFASLQMLNRTGGDAAAPPSVQQAAPVAQVPAPKPSPPPVVFPDPLPVAEVADGYAFAAPVMSFAPNPFGLHDMGGNVGEWVSDWFNRRQDMRVVRGSSFKDMHPGALCSAFRLPVGAISKQDGIGFRVVLEP